MRVVGTVNDFSVQAYSLLHITKRDRHRVKEPRWQLPLHVLAVNLLHIVEKEEQIEERERKDT